MNRLFGKKKVDVPAVNIGDVGSKVDGRVTNLDTKILGLENELKKYKSQLVKARGPSAVQIKKRAMTVLKRKKMYENQRDQLSAQSFNIEQVKKITQINKKRLRSDTYSYNIIFIRLALQSIQLKIQLIQ